MNSRVEIKAYNDAKEIVIAKLSASAPNHTNADSGAAINAMFNEIYKNLLAILESADGR